ncbi:MAG: arginine deiminase family protein [Bacteroidales bacterium]|jgi:arginine deiminase
MLKLNIASETARLEAVIIHQPGPEVENMTPATAERALYSDILNLSIASREYSQFEEVLKLFSHVYEVKDLLAKTLTVDEAKESLIGALSAYISDEMLIRQLNALTNEELCRQVLEGVPLNHKTLTNFLSKNRYFISPLHNIFFTRDASFVIGNTVFIGSMAKKIREPETILMETLFKYYPEFSCNVVHLTGQTAGNELHTIEGGDILVLNEDTLIIGIGTRSSAAGVDHLIQELVKHAPLKHVLIQELPDEPESFIHLDMVFTLLSQDECMVYEPLILGENRYHTVLMHIEDKKIKEISYVDNLIEGLHSIGADLKPITCGGARPILQEREQWHSGANFLALEHSKLIGYFRNVHTAEELAKNGYKVITAMEIINDRRLYDEYRKILITFDGSELSRGGGGARCMTMPLLRK